jgi:hypothetical protein
MTGNKDIVFSINILDIVYEEEIEEDMSTLGLD